MELDSQESPEETKSRRWSWTLKRARKRPRAGGEAGLSREPGRDREQGGGAGLSREPGRDQEQGGGAGLSREPGRDQEQEVELDSQESPEEIKSREVELDSQRARKRSRAGRWRNDIRSGIEPVLLLTSLTLYCKAKPAHIWRI